MRELLASVACLPYNPEKSTVHNSIKNEDKLNSFQNITIIYHLSIYLYVYLLSPPRHFGLPGLNFQEVMVVIMGWSGATLVKIRVKPCP